MKQIEAGLSVEEIQHANENSQKNCKAHFTALEELGAKVADVEQLKHMYVQVLVGVDSSHKSGNTDVFRSAVNVLLAFENIMADRVRRLWTEKNPPENFRDPTISDEMSAMLGDLHPVANRNPSLDRGANINISVHPLPPEAAERLEREFGGDVVLTRVNPKPKLPMDKVKQAIKAIPVFALGGASIDEFEVIRMVVQADMDGEHNRYFRVETLKGISRYLESAPLALRLGSLLPGTETVPEEETSDISFKLVDALLRALELDHEREKVVLIREFIPDSGSFALEPTEQ